MGAFADISLYDGQDTPVSRTFDASRFDKSTGAAVYHNRTSGVPILMPRVEIAFFPAQPAKASQKGAEIDKQMSRATTKVFVPVADDVGLNDAGYTPAPSLAYVCSSTTTYMIPQRSSAAARKDLVGYTASINAHAVVKAMVVDGEAVW